MAYMYSHNFFSWLKIFFVKGFFVDFFFYRDYLLKVLFRFVLQIMYPALFDTCLLGNYIIISLSLSYPLDTVGKYN